MNKSLIKGLRILSLFDVSSPMLTVSDISKRLGYSQTTTYRLIKTLIQNGIIQESNNTSQYMLGVNMMRMGALAKRNFNLSDVALPFMKELSNITKETVLLTVINETQGMCLERVESKESIRLSLYEPGARLPLHCGASNKILMAYLSEKEINNVIAKEGLKRFTPNTITDIDKLIVHLKQIKQQGFAISDQEVDRGARAVAAPVFDQSGNMIAGISIAGPAFRINKKRLNALGKLVVQYAKKISANLGYTP